MGYMCDVKASVTSLKGTLNDKLNDNFYLNGRYMKESEIQSVLVSSQYKSDSFIFSVSDSMDITDEEKGISLSAIKDLKKFHDKYEGASGSLSETIARVSNIVYENSNLIKSIYSGDDLKITPSFSALLIKDDRAYAISLGNCKIYIIRGGDIKQLSVDWEKTQRLLKMGIITKDQADDLAQRFKIPTEKSKYEILKSDEFIIKPGDMFILTTDGLTDGLEPADINDVFGENTDMEESLNKVRNAAVKKGVLDSVTVMAVRIGKMYDDSGTVMAGQGSEASGFKKDPEEKVVKAIRRIRASDVRRIYISTTVFVLIIATIITSVYLIKRAAGKKPDPDSSLAQSTDKSDPLSETQTTTSDGTEATQASTTAPAADEPTLYTVKRGDTLSKISREFYNDPEKYNVIMEYNNITDPTTLQIGQVLKIPNISE